ncbi:MAG: hypothetical protein HY323_00255 [Betaproteobacteria bacterium]|nr:hypothetical protein [Betaproteobacteria bacterium]MBI3935383.1 hypothetical protein [Betaproteobacteria bacterium]
MTLGRAQARALGFPDLPIAVVPHPFGRHTRDKVREIAEQCVEDIAKLACTAVPPGSTATTASGKRALKVDVADDADAINRLFRERRWTDGLPVVPPTVERVERMLRCTPRAADELVAAVAPGFGVATVERIAINAVMAGCDAECLPVLVAAVEAMAAPEFNAQGIQATTNPVAVWLIVNGPIAKRLHLNAGINCLGQGNWGNATLGRALRLILQNIGRALPGEMDRATLGQPGKYSFCCAENEEQNPWEPLHVERGLRPEQSAVTVVGAEGTLNMNTHSKDPDEVLRVFAETLPRPSGNDYFLGGDPWIILCPEHAQVLKAGGLSKAEVKHRLWEASKMPARRMTAVDMQLTRVRRGTELGAISPDTLLPICPAPEQLGIVVCGGPGTHSLYVPSFGNTRSVTREVIWAA